MKPRLTRISLFTIVSFSLQFLATRANWEFTKEGVEYQRLLRSRAPGVNRYGDNQLG